MNKMYNLKIQNGARRFLENNVSDFFYQHTNIITPFDIKIQLDYLPSSTVRYKVGLASAAAAG